MPPINFSEKILTWFDQHGRTHLPWQQNPNAYRVWISEIMLQQTQVSKVIDYYHSFISHFKSVRLLSEAPLDDVLALWSGLGYYSRARNIHKTAQIIQHEYAGRFPKDLAQLMELPGIGRSTAGAILSLGMQQTATILDGNVKRVLARIHRVQGDKNSSKTLKELWAIATDHTPIERCKDYNQAMMDLGALICKKHHPLCKVCPLQKDCEANIHSVQADFPHSKPRNKTKRCETTFMLLLQNPHKEVLLTRRPNYGIWGGLWVFPMFDQEDTLLSSLNLSPPKYQQNNLPSFIHKFSHFDLTIHPVCIQLKKSHCLPSVAEVDNGCWHHLTTALPGGTATPIIKLLKLITEHTVIAN